jgi:putative transposase
MARSLRIEYAGAVFHITSRGNAHKKIYLDEADRDDFLATLTWVAARFGWVCHAYRLMNNHYHPLIETSKPNLSRINKGRTSHMDCASNQIAGRVTR